MAQKEALDSEFRAYKWIEDELRDKGWNTQNPSRHPKGQVWTQQECLSHPAIKTALGLERPENIVKISEDTVWVIEAKRTRSEMQDAIDQAVERAKKINAGRVLKALFVTGVAGNREETIAAETLFWKRGEFIPVTINGHKASSLLSPQTIKSVLVSGAKVEDVVIDEKLFLRKAIKINEILHAGSISKDERSRKMAALLLSLIGDTIPNVNDKLGVLISDINARVKGVLEEHDKGQFTNRLIVEEPLSAENHVKYKKALVDTIQELLNLDIRSAMNSGNDVLGKFYEVFLKYGNGAKELGIVLTPRHVTAFAVKTTSVGIRDIVFDPTCGTGGFLVASYDAAKRTATPRELKKFRENNLFGIEEREDVTALAIVNMIFRGDGNNGITDGDCFAKSILPKVAGGYQIRTGKPADNPPVHKVLMNPPFAKKGAREKEYHFVNYALSQMESGGVLFSVLPYGALVKPDKYYKWRVDDLLTKHTLLAVVTFPPELFYPVGVHTVGLYLKKGIPHDKEANVLWVRAVHDGFLKSKGKRLHDDSEPDELKEFSDIITAFVLNPGMAVPNIEMRQKACPIDFSDPLLELVPENYLDQAPPSQVEITEGVDSVMRATAGFLVRFGAEYLAEVHPPKKK